MTFRTRLMGQIHQWNVLTGLGVIDAGELGLVAFETCDLPKEVRKCTELAGVFVSFILGTNEPGKHWRVAEDIHILVSPTPGGYQFMKALPQISLV